VQILTAEQLKAAAAAIPQTTTVEIAELGGALELRRLTPAQVLDLVVMMQDKSKQMHAIYQAIVWACEAVGTVEELEALHLPFGVVMQIFEAAGQQSGLQNDIAEDKAKN